MATQRITRTDVHLVELEDGNVSFTFEVLSHDQYTEAFALSNVELVRKVTKGVAGLKIIRDDVEVPPEQTLEALCEDPGLTNWVFEEYGVFWGKKARTKPSKKPPDAGQGSVSSNAASTSSVTSV